MNRDELVAKVTALTKLNRKLQRETPKFGTPKDTTSFRSEINNDINSGNEICEYLENLSDEYGDDEQNEKLLTDAEPIINEFKKLKETIDTNIINNPNPINNNQDDNTYNVELQEQQQQQQVQGFQEIDLEKAEEKAQNYEKVADDIQNLNEAYQDLHNLVDEQGNQVTKIEKNVEEARNEVESGKENVDKAAEHQNAARKKKIMIIIGCLVIIGLLFALLGGFGVFKK